jgi:hypothetical protein
MYTQTIQETSQNKQYKEHKIHRTTQKIHRATQQLGRVLALPRLCGFYPGICLTAEEKKYVTRFSHTDHN